MSGVVVWMTGVEHAGKTTMARALTGRLQPRPILLDEEELQAAFGELIPFEPGDGERFYGAVAHLATVLAAQGFVVLVAAKAPSRAHRRLAREHAPRFIEVHVATPPTDLSPGRQPHGLYFSSESREDDHYEVPVAADVIARGGQDHEALERILHAIDPAEPHVAGAAS